MKSLQNYISEAMICEAKPTAEHNEIIEKIYKELEKLNGSDINVRYNVAGSGKSSSCKIVFKDNSLKDNFVGELTIAMAYERNNFFIYIPTISLAKNKSGVLTNILLNYVAIDKICPTWKPSFKAVRKPGRSVTYIIAPNDYDTFLTAMKNITKTFDDIKGLFSEVIDNYDDFYVAKAEEAAMKRLGKNISKAEFEKEYKKETDAYRSLVLPEITDVILDNVPNKALKAIKEIL